MTAKATLALSILVCSRLHAQQAGVAGTAVDAVTRQPLAGVHITLRPMGSDGRTSDDAVSYGAMSGREGHFSISGIAPAVYFVLAEHNGYILAPDAAAALSLKSGEERTGIMVALSRRAVIYGHILDDLGDPVQHVQVCANPVTGSAGTFVQSDPTDERGMFRLRVAPGKYRVSAEFRNIGTSYEIRNDGRDTSAWATTYYPSAASQDQATVVEVASGQDLDGIDIRLRRTRSLTIGGTVTGIPAGGGQVVVSLLDTNGYPMREFPIKPDGQFTISGLTAASYRLIAVVHSAEAPLCSRSLGIDAGTAAQNGVNLALVRGEAIAGTLRIEGDPPRIGPQEKLTVRLVSDILDTVCPDPKKAEIGPDGAFRIDEVFPERHSVEISPMPENAFIKSVKVNGAAAQDGIVDLSQGVNGDSVEITLSRNGGRVEGRVPDAEAAAFVALVQTVDEFRYNRLTRVEPGAKFSFTGLRPGKYRLLVVDPQQFTGASSRDSELVKASFTAAPEIGIHEGDRIEKDVTPMKPEKPDAK